MNEVRQELSFRNAGEPAVVANTPFYVTDKQGRDCAYRATIVTIIVSESLDGNYCPPAVNAPGKWYLLHGCPTRNGHDYGPSFNYSFWPTYEAAWAHASKMADNARKSYAKKFAKAA